MNNRIKAILIASLVLITFTQSVWSAKIEAERSGSKINVKINGKFFTSYVFSSEEKYPFFFPVNGPISGGSVTSMRNSLHPHQNSLFFTCDKLNGGNYWQEGLDRGQIVSKGAHIIESDTNKVIISDECIWNRKDAESPVKDLRTITISSPAANMYQIDFEITLEALVDIEILKTNHSLFSARIATDLCVTNGGTMVNAQGERGEKDTFGKKSEWMDYHNKRGNAIEGLAMIQHPSNIMYPFPWFTRDYGLFSPMPTYWQDKLSFPKGEKISLRYRVLVHAGDEKEADIATHFLKFSKE